MRTRAAAMAPYTHHPAHRASSRAMVALHNSSECSANYAVSCQKTMPVLTRTHTHSLSLSNQTPRPETIVRRHTRLRSNISKNLQGAMRGALGQSSLGRQITTDGSPRVRGGVKFDLPTTSYACCISISFGPKFWGSPRVLPTQKKAPKGVQEGWGRGWTGLPP